MINPKSQKIILLLTAYCLLLTVIIGCGGKKKETRRGRRVRRDVLLMSKIKKFDEEKFLKYEYQGVKYKNPFISPKGGVTVSLGEGEINLQGLKLDGIIVAKEGSYALISEAGGNSYIVKKGRFYDRRNKKVPGVKATVHKDKVIVSTKKGIKILKIEEE